MTTIILLEKLGNDLFLRETANQLFDSIGKLESKTITLDFSNVR